MPIGPMQRTGHRVRQRRQPAPRTGQPAPLQRVFPRWPEDEVPSGYVTNGVHVAIWAPSATTVDVERYAAEPPTTRCLSSADAVSGHHRDVLRFGAGLQGAEGIAPAHRPARRTLRPVRRRKETAESHRVHIPNLRRRPRLRRKQCRTSDDHLTAREQGHSASSSGTFRGPQGASGERPGRIARQIGYHSVAPRSVGAIGASSSLRKGSARPWRRTIRMPAGRLLRPNLDRGSLSHAGSTRCRARPAR